MKRFLLYIFLFLSLNIISQEKNINSKIITFDYTYQVPINQMAIDFGHNSSLGFNYLTNNNNLLIGLDANFMFGNNVKNDSLLRNIATEEGWLINLSGELDTILLYERGWNSHFLFGRSFLFQRNNLSGIYVYGGLGYLQHKIRMESNRTDIPQIEYEYIKGYDKFTNGVSSKICVSYKYFSKHNSLQYHVGAEFINAFTKNRRSYNFSEMEEYSNDLKFDQLIGVKFGVIIPIYRNNEEKFHYF